MMENNSARYFARRNAMIRQAGTILAERNLHPAIDDDIVRAVAGALEECGACLIVGMEEEDRVLMELDFVAKWLCAVPRLAKVKDRARRIGLAIQQIDPDGSVLSEIENYEATGRLIPDKEKLS